MKVHHLKLYVGTVLSWFVYAVVLLPLIWYWIRPLNPVPEMARNRLIPGNEILYYLVVYLGDFALNLLFVAPLAFLLHKVLPARPWPYIIAAVLLVFVWNYKIVLGDLEMLQYFLTNNRPLVGILISLSLLPVAFCLFRYLNGPNTV